MIFCCFKLPSSRMNFKKQYSLKSRYIFGKPILTEIEKNNCFSIYTRSDLFKIRKGTTKKYYLIDRSSVKKLHVTYMCERYSSQNIQACQFASLSLRKQQRNCVKWNRVKFELFPYLRRKGSFVIFC